MTTIPVRVHLECVEKDSTDLGVNITTIRKLSDQETYMFPPDYQDHEQHTELCKLASIRNACKALNKRGQYRNITVSLSEEIISDYFDTDLNFVFKGFYLEEHTEPSINITEESNTSDKRERELFKIIERLNEHLYSKENKKDTNISQVQKMFVLEKFEGKGNAKEWLRLFNDECIRYNIQKDETRIQILRLFLENNALEWYSASLCKLTISGTWKDWTESFLKTYADKSWRLVSYAYKFKFISGSLLDYALKKERLLLETEPTMSDCSRINHIVIGLPTFISDRLDKEEIQSTEDLMNQIRRYDQIPNSKIKQNENRAAVKYTKTEPRSIDNKMKWVEKKPCSICDSLGFSGQFHSTDMCRNKGKLKELKSVNMTETDIASINVQKE